MRKPLARGLFGKLFAGKKDQTKIKGSAGMGLESRGTGGDGDEFHLGAFETALEDGARRDWLEFGEVIELPPPHLPHRRHKNKNAVRGENDKKAAILAHKRLLPHERLHDTAAL